MSIGTLYISYQNFNWDSLTNKPGIFVNGKTIKKVINDEAVIDCYSTLEDLNFKADNLNNLIRLSNNICLIDLDENFVDVVSETSLYLYLNFFTKLKKLKDTTNIVNFEWINKLDKSLFKNLVGQRKTDGKNLWITGCSLTYGVGVNEHERYATLLGKTLGLPTTVLAKPGSSIPWQADQILQSDIKSSDIVIWGLTSFNRLNVANGYSWESCPIPGYFELPANKQYWNIDYFDSLTQSTTCIKDILQVINFCNKIGAELYLVNLLEHTWANLLFSNDTNYIDLTAKEVDANGRGIYVDLGTDNSHPGPKQHQLYAEAIFNLIKENNHG
jgi:hypothetical protein